MSVAAPPAQHAPERSRVKVYELKNNDWYDRGTGFCLSETQNQAGQEEARITVQSEDDPTVMLLETRVGRDDGYQKQQDTLIVWTGPNGVDMALSFQEAEGCAATWAFVSEVQQRLSALGPDDSLDDHFIDPSNPMLLPNPGLGNLTEVENIMRAASATAQGRDALAKFIMAPENLYIQKLVPLVEDAEDLEDLENLHRLCNIVKTLILLNDNAVIEYVVRDEIILGVVGALEYDPDFPTHKANHRRYLSDESKFKQVVKIDNPDTTRKIHYTYRLQYLKDVVLARILDDPTFSVLNSLIFFHQVDIVNHIQSNPDFLGQLFAVFGPQEVDQERKKDAVLFIQNCCAVAKNIQAQSRQQLFYNFINGGLLDVVVFALRHQDVAVRVAGTDILVALIDHDPGMMRTYIFRAINERTKPLTDTLIELLLVEVDLGVKAQMSDAIKVLLDSTANPSSVDMLGRTNGEFMAVSNKAVNRPLAVTTPQTDAFISNFYDESAKKLFAPLKALEHRQDLSDLTAHEASLFEHLIGILCFFIRQHAFRSKFFTLSEGLHCRVAQLLGAPQKHLKLTALKWFRTCIYLQDEYHNRHLIQHELFGPILGLVEDTMPRDNLLNSVCLELFSHIVHESIKQLLDHIVETYRDRLLAIKYVDVFLRLVHRYDQMHYHPPPGDTSYSTQTAETPNRSVAEPLPRWFAGMKSVDPNEESYFDSLDTEEDVENSLPTPASSRDGLDDRHPPIKSLVMYPEDDEDDAMDMLASDSASGMSTPSSAPILPSITVPSSVGSESEAEAEVEGDGKHPDTPRPVDNKRRRTEDDDGPELSDDRMKDQSVNDTGLGSVKVASGPLELADKDPSVQGVVSFTPAGPTKRRFSLADHKDEMDEKSSGTQVDGHHALTIGGNGSSHGPEAVEHADVDGDLRMPEATRPEIRAGQESAA